MSEPKVQLVDPQGNMSVTGMSAVGVITASSFDGISNSSATGITGTPDLDVGIVTATSFVGQGKGHAAGLAGTPELNLGVTTATSFVGDATGKAAGLTGTPNLTVGLVTATGFAGNVTGTVTGNVTGLAASITPGSNLGVGVCTAIQYHGDGSTLTGAGSSAYIAQNITATGAETIIDLSYGNLIYYDSSSNTTIGFASTSAAEQITFIRDTGNSYTITWPDRVKWNGGTTPTLISGNPRASTSQIFRFTTVDTGLNYNAWEEIKTDSSAIQLWTWGLNNQGSLGQNQGPSLSRVSSPVQIPGSTWSALDGPYGGSDSNLVATKTDGTIWSWGYNGIGALGQNNLTRYSSPMQIGTDTTWKQASTGYRFSLAVKTDGTLWSWGYGERGNLANNSSGYYNMRSSPIQVPGTNWSRAHGLGNSSAAYKTDGTLWMWGLQYDGAFGQNGPSIHRSSPTQVGGTTWEFGGYSSKIVKKSDGTWWGWGANGFGVLGLNDNTNRSSPTQLPGTWATIHTAGAALGVKTDGTLWSWGRNQEGELGHNNEVNVSSPIQVGSGTDWSTNIGSVGGYGNSWSAAIKTNGTLWVWGQNSNGAFGLNQPTATKYSSPVQLAGTWTAIKNQQESYGVLAMRAV